MNVRIFSDTKRTELDKAGEVYLSLSGERETGLLYFRVDWADEVLPKTRFKIEIKCLKPKDFNFIKLSGTGGFIYNADSITCESVTSDQYKFIPFDLHKITFPAVTPATFRVTLSTLAGGFIAKRASSLLT